MSSPDAPKPLSLSLKQSGGIVGISFETRINNQELTYGRAPRRNQTFESPAIQLTPDDRHDITTLVEALHATNPNAEYKPTRQGADGFSYVLQVHEPVAYVTRVTEGSRPPAEFFRLVDKLGEVTRPKPQTPPQS